MEAMKVTLKYEEADDQALRMTLRLTLPEKYVNGKTKDVVKLFVDHYNKKNADSPLNADDLHLKIVGGDHLSPDAVVRDSLGGGDECYLLPESASMRPRAEPAKVAPPPEVKVAAPKAQGGKVRCKRFGCQKFFDPDGPGEPCVFHKSPPIFHETAKWWSCCPDRKAYDWEEFMRIPGCQSGANCTTTPEGQDSQKRFLGGCDLRAENAPVRLDADAPKDPRHKLDDLRRGLMAIGVDGALFEKVWAKYASETSDMDKVVEIFRARFLGLLNTA